MVGRVDEDPSDGRDPDRPAAGLLGETDEWYASQTAWRNALRQALAKGPSGRDDVEALLRDVLTDLR